jgi:acyl-CoA reductase-like NAD-dependent aldehyde dehydrogenase
MPSLEDDIRTLVGQVLKEMAGDAVKPAPAAAGASDTSGTPGIFGDIDLAISAAEKAHLDLMRGTLEMRKAIVQAMRDAVLSELELLSHMAVEETGMGRRDDKVKKNRLAAVNTPGPEDLEPVSYTDDHGMTLVERAPYGLIGAITPSTNPTETIINNGISMISGGNSVVFNPHPAAKRVCAYLVGLLNKAIVNAGGPANLLAMVAEPTIESAQILMNHPKVRLLAVTGGPNVVRVAMQTEKKVIAAGPGNPPVVVDETADINLAGKQIVNGASFDNNIVCICEKEVYAVASVADRLKDAMKRNGAYEVTGAAIERLTSMVIKDPGRPGHEGMANKDFVGKDASVIAAAAGIEVPSDTRLLIAEVDKHHPLVWTEQLMPVMPVVRVADADEGIEAGFASEHGFRHTAMMYSKNIEKLSKMAKKMNCSVFIKNGPCYAGLGFGGAGFCSYTIASPTGEGLTRARTFTRERRCTLVDYFRIV